MGYEGASVPNPTSYPDYAPLRKYIDSISDLLEKYPTNEFNLTKSAERMTKAGWAKNGDGFWAKDGKVFEIPLIAWAFFGEVGPIIAEQLRKAGFEASYSQPADIGTQVQQGTAWGGASLCGHGGSVADPYLTLELYHSRHIKPTGEPTWPFFRWKNEAYDAIVEEISTVPMNSPRLFELFRKAMEIWLPELPDPPLFQFYHRIPNNTEYWTNWPSDENNYVNEAWWHLTFPILLLNLKAAK